MREEVSSIWGGEGVLQQSRSLDRLGVCEVGRRKHSGSVARTRGSAAGMGVARLVSAVEIKRLRQRRRLLPEANDFTDKIHIQFKTSMDMYLF